VATRHAIHEKTDSGLAEFVPDLSRRGSWMLYLNDVPQSHVDLEDPTYLEFEYVRRIAHLIDLAFPPGQRIKALHLGGGAMTLPRYIAVTRPGSAQLVAETDARLTELVREHLPMPKGKPSVRVRARDARAVLESVRPASYDVVVSDVFDGPDTPPHLTTSGLVSAAARALRPDGVYAVNVADGPPLRHVRGQIATLRESFGDCCMVAEAGVLRGRRRANLVLLASQRELPCGELRRRCAGDPFPARVVNGAELGKFTGGAAIVRDESPTNW
jgi:spermidine synthase